MTLIIKLRGIACERFLKFPLGYYITSTLQKYEFVIWTTAFVKLSLYAPTHKLVKQNQTICWLLPMNCLSVFDHFVG